MEENLLFRYDNVRLSPLQQIGMHEQDTWELSYVAVGSGIRIIGDSATPFGSGDVVLVPPGMPHCWRFDGKENDGEGRIANISVMLSSALLDSVSTAFPALRERIGRLKSMDSAIGFGKESAAKIIALLEEMDGLSEEERTGCVVRLLALLGGGGECCVAGTYRNTGKAQKRLDRVRTYVVCNYDRRITAEEIAAFAGMNKSAFCVFFRRMTGKTFMQYLNEYRIGLACRLLGKGEMSVSEVCYAVGFGDVHYFSRVFKRITGISPGKYRDIE